MTTFRIEMSMMPNEDLHRVVKNARRQQAINSTPVGKRGKKARELAVCPTCGDEDCDCGEYEMDENDTKVSMGRSAAMPPAGGVTSEDLPRGTKIPKAKMPKRLLKNGKKS